MAAWDAQVRGRLRVPDPDHLQNKQSAIALVYDLTVATRHTGDFARTCAKLTNPFAESRR